jgi:adenosylhomocysteine nucleosidase
VPLYGSGRFPTDVALTARLAQAVQRALPGAHLHRGLVVSGDRFIASAADSQALRLALPDALAVEMEGAAFAQVCGDYGVPFAAVRTVSDRADDEAHGDFLSFIDQVASRHSAAIVQSLLQAA